MLRRAVPLAFALGLAALAAGCESTPFESSDEGAILKAAAPGLGVFIVAKYYYEGIGFIVLDTTSGAETTVSPEPLALRGLVRR